MKPVLFGAALAAAMAAIVGPVRAQAPAPAVAQPPWPPAAYAGGAYRGYPVSTPTPRDAYRDGTINRWQLEQLEGPLPQALQGPSVDGNRGGDGGGSGDRGG
jgi:hypothetical protein